MSNLKMNKEYLQKPVKIKLTQVEHDILCSFAVYSNNKFKNYPPLDILKRNEYFKNIDDEMRLEEILNKCEVIEDE